MRFKKGDRIPEINLVQKNGEPWFFPSKETNKTLFFLFRPVEMESSLFRTALCQLRDNMKLWRAMEISVIAICSGKNHEQVSRFHNQLSLNFELLSDPGMRTAHIWKLEDQSTQQEDKSVKDWFVLLLDENHKAVYTESGRSSKALPGFNGLLKRLMSNSEL
ncbi:MAG: redoxin domain-containing protein [Balneolaceae bacterium]